VKHALDYLPSDDWWGRTLVNQSRHYDGGLAQIPVTIPDGDEWVNAPYPVAGQIRRSLA
jgi:hypothetical protein